MHKLGQGGKKQFSENKKKSVFSLLNICLTEKCVCNQYCTFYLILMPKFTKSMYSKSEQDIYVYKKSLIVKALLYIRKL